MISWHDYWSHELEQPCIVTIRFDKRFDLVDFGEAVKVGTSVNIAAFSEKRIQLAIADAFVDRLQWDYKHDVAMLARSCFDVPITDARNTRKRSRSNDQDEQHHEQRRRIM